MQLIPTFIIVSVLGFFIVLTLMCIGWHWRQSRVRYVKRHSANSYQTPPVRRLTIQGGRVVDVADAFEKADVDDEQFVDGEYPTLHAFVEDPPPAEPRVEASQIRSNRAKIEIHSFPKPPTFPGIGRRTTSSSAQIHDVHSLAIPPALLSERSGSVTLPRPSLINIEKKTPVQPSKKTFGKVEHRSTYSPSWEPTTPTIQEPPEILDSPLKLGIAHIFPSSGRTSYDRSSISQPSSPVPPLPPPPPPPPPSKSASSSRSTSKHAQKPPPIPPNPRTSSRSAKNTPPTVPTPRKRSKSAQRPPPLDLGSKRNSQQYDKAPTLEPSPRKSWYLTSKKTQPSQKKTVPSAQTTSDIEPSSQALKPSLPLPPEPSVRASLPANLNPAPPQPTARISLPPAQQPTMSKSSSRVSSQTLQNPPFLETSSRVTSATLQAPLGAGSSSRTSALLTKHLTPTASSTRTSAHSMARPPPLLLDPLVNASPSLKPAPLDVANKSISPTFPRPPLLERRSKPSSPSTQRPAPLDIQSDISAQVRFAPTWEASRQSFLSMTDSPFSDAHSSVEPTSPVVRAPPPSVTAEPSDHQTPPPPTPGEIEAELQPEMVARLDRPPSIDVDIPHLSTFSSFWGTPTMSDHQSADLRRGPSVMSNRSGITIASSEISSNWTIGNAQLVNIYPSVGESSTSQPQPSPEDRHTPPYAKTLRSKFGRYPRGRRDKALPTLPKSPLSMSFGMDYDDQTPGKREA